MEEFISIQRVKMDHHSMNHKTYMSEKQIQKQITNCKCKYRIYLKISSYSKPEQIVCSDSTLSDKLTYDHYILKDLLSI